MDESNTTGILKISSMHGLNYTDEREKEFVEKSLERDRERLIANMISNLRHNIPHTIVFGDVIEGPVENGYLGEPVIRLEQCILIAVSDFRDTEVGEACVADVLALNRFYYTPQRDDLEEWKFLHEEDYAARDRFNKNHYIPVWRRVE